MALLLCAAQICVNFPQFFPQVLNRVMFAGKQRINGNPRFFRYLLTITDE